MKNNLIFIKLVSALLLMPIFAFAATTPGIKPGSLFYFLDTGVENIVLFFTFNPENKAKKALEYAEERLAEIEVSAEEKNSSAIKTAITNYESNIVLATEKSKEVKDKGQEENLLTLIADNASRNQEVLSAILIKVPEEARQAITQAIEVSRKGQEEATRQIAELKSEVEQLKKEVAELKTKDEAQTKIVDELNGQKSESVPAPIKSSVPPPTETIQNSKPVTPPPPQVVLTVSAPNRSGKDITIKPGESVSININVGNPSSNNLNPGYTCVKSGDWQGQITPVDHTETSAQDSNLDFSKLLTGGNKTFKVICSNSVGDKSDFVTINIQSSINQNNSAPPDSLSKVRLIFMDGLANAIKILEQGDTKVSFRVYVYDDKGINSTVSDIKVEAPDAHQNIIINAGNHYFGIGGQCGEPGGCVYNSYYYLFTYVPKKIGTQKIKFTASKFNSSAEMVLTVSSDVCSGDSKTNVNKSIENGQIDKVKSIIEMCNGQNSAIAYMLPVAANVTNIEIVKYLLDNNFDVNYSTGWTGLIHAASRNFDMVKLLIDRGANVNLRGSDGMTALIHSFVEGENLEIPKLLLEKGANPNSTTNDGSTALLRAPLHSVEAVKLLLDYGADPNIKYYNGSTALMNAVWSGSLESVKLLVGKGADVNAKNDSGITPLKWAIEKGHTEIVDYLKQNGATN